MSQRHKLIQVAHRTITKSDEPSYAETEWRMWLNEPDPLQLTMLPLVDCVRSSEPDRVAGLARHLQALSEDVLAGHGVSVDCDGFREFVDAECEMAIGFAGVVNLSTAKKLGEVVNLTPEGAVGSETPKTMSVLSPLVVSQDVGQRLIFEAWGDTGNKLAKARGELLSNHQKLVANPTLGVAVHQHAEYRLQDNFLYRVLADGRIHIARVLHDVGYFAYQLF